MDIGRGVPVAFQVNGDLGADGVIGGLYERRGIHRKLVEMDRSQDPFGVLHTAQACAGDDGIRDPVSGIRYLASGIFQTYPGRSDAHLYQPAEPSR